MTLNTLSQGVAEAERMRLPAKHVMYAVQYFYPRINLTVGNIPHMNLCCALVQSSVRVSQAEVL